MLRYCLMPAALMCSRRRFRVCPDSDGPAPSGSMDSQMGGWYSLGIAYSERRYAA
jgi:hypothetical protein